MRKFSSRLVEKLLSLGVDKETVDKIQKSEEEAPKSSSKAEAWERSYAELTDLGLIGDLRNVGIEIKDVWDLVNTRASYPEAIPILARHLRLPYDDDNKESIARALAVPEAKEYWDELLQEYRRAQKRVKTGLACALTVIAKKTKRYHEVLELLRDETLGSSRIILLGVLSSSRNPEVSGLIDEFADHPILGYETRIILKRRNKKKKKEGLG